jgi:hypothetical protein
MRRQVIIEIVRLTALCAVGLLTATAFGRTAPRGETFAALASVTTIDGVTATAPVTIVVHRWSTNPDRDALAAAIRAGGSAQARALLLARADVGAIHLAGTTTAIKHAHGRPTDVGRVVTVVTAEPILFAGGSLPRPRPRAGYDLGVVWLDLDAYGSGEGELAPAATVRLDVRGAVATEDYGAEVVRLINVVRQ